MPADTAHAAMQEPCAALQAASAAGVPAPIVYVPATAPAPAQHATQAALQHVWHAAYVAAPVKIPAEEGRGAAVKTSSPNNATAMGLILLLIECSPQQLGGVCAAVVSEANVR